MWVRLLLRLWKQVNGILSEFSYVQLCYFWKMACGYFPALFCIDALGIKQEVSGTVAALLSWLQGARTTLTGFSSIFLLFMLMQCPPPLLCILMSCIFSLLVCHCKQGRTNLTVVD